MPKEGRTTEFWLRLKAARETCDPPKSMLQKDIAKEYRAAFQSTVTKWKTGGLDGKTLPSASTILEMAIDTDVDVNWLWSGRGEMRPKRIDDPLTQKFIQALEPLTEDEKKKLLSEAAVMPMLRDIEKPQRQASAQNRKLHRVKA